MTASALFNIHFKGRLAAPNGNSRKCFNFNSKCVTSCLPIPLVCDAWYGKKHKEKKDGSLSLWMQYFLWKKDMCLIYFITPQHDNCENEMVLFANMLRILSLKKTQNKTIMSATNTHTHTHSTFIFLDSPWPGLSEIAHHSLWMGVWILRCVPSPPFLFADDPSTLSSIFIYLFFLHWTNLWCCHSCKQPAFYLRAVK